MKKKIAVAGAVIFLCGAMAILVACSKDKDEGSSQGPVIKRVQVSPVNARPGDVIRVVVESRSPDNHEVEYEYKWFVNGDVVGEKESEFDTKLLRPGDEIYLQVRGKDKKTGLLGRWFKSALITVDESLPGELGGVDIQPQPLYQFTPAKAVVDWGKAKEEDTKLFYRWLVNDKILESDDAKGPELPTKFFKRKDTIKAAISIDEKFPMAKTKVSPTYTVYNALPEWGSPRVKMEGDIAYIQLSATDPDGDPLEYYIVDAPNGTGLDDPSGGRVHVDMKAIEPGSYSITFGVKDGQGADVQYSTNITVPESDKPGTKSPEQPETPQPEAPAPAEPAEPTYQMPPLTPAPQAGGSE